MVAGRNMHEQWVEIERPGAGTGYVNVYHLEMVAPAVHVLAQSVRLRVGTTRQSAYVQTSARAGGTYETRGVRRAADGRFWYQVEVSGVRGWLPPETLQRDYGFPAVHFVAGVFRYARKDYPRAIQEFQRFIERGKDSEDNVTLAAAYQYLAASKVAAAGINGIGAARDAMQDVRNALQHTPYDPNAYALSSVIQLGSLSNPEAAIHDLGQSLTLDAENPTAKTLLRSLSSVADAHRTRSLTDGTDPQRLEAQIAALRERMNAVNKDAQPPE
jgi:tetratricopeptide (TPR) repeat protein